MGEKAKARDAALLAHARKRLRLTQKQAAELTGGGHNAFSRYERGEARKNKNSVLIRIAISNGFCQRKSNAENSACSFESCRHEALGSAGASHRCIVSFTEFRA
jgi:hypothetical protein